jgi:hypothetical protein
MANPPMNFHSPGQENASTPRGAIGSSGRVPDASNTDLFSADYGIHCIEVRDKF